MSDCRQYSDSPTAWSQDKGMKKLSWYLQRWYGSPGTVYTKGYEGSKG
jgi:hypothetical protein